MNKNLSKTFDAILRDNHTLALQQTATDWQDAVRQVVQLLVQAKMTTPDYADAIIKATEELGPYYLVAENVAMPHAVSGPYNLDNGFALLTLKEPVLFGTEKIQVLICLSSITPDFHVAVALPQIAALFDDLDMGNKMAQCQTEAEIYQLISGIDFSKYLN
ncbi:PTS system ascorbate-specific IIA component [Mycoplasmoides fastidiosum]|uniref:Ascorbate-specific PTS system EIIA component n=1 Tax=Mycoplasmoides fastidiosum TaxID=92758 RepID=A0ABU0LZG7_9BACT|nr:PTS sugar transporter subunit IIA [Mycoplasmoides fastidiosum]MDQ0514101.1 PTS system ascorbate-specific IIA component [Mycoplasmoides fastidiosum]UUD37490.1 PTS sugar transporter subunit IIA [Mycoplasmoides fastidiosum]